MNQLKLLLNISHHLLINLGKHNIITKWFVQASAQHMRTAFIIYQ